MKIVALLTVRNEELYIERCIEHLRTQGVDVYLTDNGSMDNTIKIAKRFIGKGIMKIEHLPYRGSFELYNILKHEETIALNINADWFIHHDADEIREAPKPYKTLLDGIMHVDKNGYNAINFDEFVFVPTNADEPYENKDYFNGMKHYYFYAPHKLRRVNAWKNTKTPIDLTSHAGHMVSFDGINIFPTNFILRHYLVLSKDHARNKYGFRKYSEKEIVDLGWHKNRAAFDPEALTLPNKEQLKIIDPNNEWDRSDPWKAHFFINRNGLKSPTVIPTLSKKDEK